MTADLPTVPDEVYTAAVKAYCHALPSFPSDSLHDDLSTDAVGFRAALAVAFAAGRASLGELVEVGDVRTHYESMHWYADGNVERHHFYGPDEKELRDWAAKKVEAEVNDPANDCVRGELHAYELRTYHANVQVVTAFERKPVAADGEVAP